MRETDGSKCPYGSISVTDFMRVFHKGSSDIKGPPPSFRACVRARVRACITWSTADARCVLSCMHEEKLSRLLLRRQSMVVDPSGPIMSASKELHGVMYI